MTLSRSRSHVGRRGRRSARWAAVLLGVTLPLLMMTPGYAATTAKVAGWHMNETSGAMVDYIDGHNGTVTNVTRGVSGASGKAYRFKGPGSGSKVVVPNSADFNIGTGNFTIQAWVRFISTPAGLGEDSFDIIRKGLTGSQYWKMEISRDLAKLTCHFTGSTGIVDKTAGPSLNDGVWHKISCQKLASSVKMRVDGSVVATIDTAVGTASNSSDVVFGQKGDGTDVLKGDLDEAGIAKG